MGGIGVKPRSRRIDLRVVFFALLPLWACSPHEDLPAAESGVIDLAGWDFVRDGALRLDGEWSFEPRQWLDADTADFRGETKSVPGLWGDRARGKGERSQHGYGTYGLKVVLPESAGPLALRVSTIATAYELYVDGELVASAGRVGTSADEARPAYLPQLVALSPAADRTLQLVLHVSNYHYAKGGLWEPIWLGSLQELRHEREGRVGLAMFVAGAFLLLGLYHLIVWAVRRSDLSALWFALMCGGIAVRGLTVDEVYLAELLPSLGWDAISRLEYSSMLVALGFVSLFLGSLFPGEMRRGLVRAFSGLCWAVTLVVLVLPVDLFSRGLPFIQGMLIFGSIVGPALTAVAWSRGREGALFFLVGLVAMAIAAFHDILISVFRDLPSVDVFGGRLYLQPVGLLIFALCQSAMLAVRSSHSTAALESASAELREARDELEVRVADRTAALEAANRELERLAGHDDLTKIANRRTFDEQLALAWNDHSRRQTPLAVVMADVDQFKGFNDRYGHLAGDDALRQVAQAAAACAHRPRDLVARYGGEELVALLGDTDTEGAAAVAERLRQAVEALAIPHEGNSPAVVTLSVGVAACVPTRDTAPQSLQALADAALYRAKSGGRNRVVIGGDAVALAGGGGDGEG